MVSECEVVGAFDKSSKSSLRTRLEETPRAGMYIQPTTKPKAIPHSQYAIQAQICVVSDNKHNAIPSSSIATCVAANLGGADLHGKGKHVSKRRCLASCRTGHFSLHQLHKLLPTLLQLFIHVFNQIGCSPPLTNLDKRLPTTCRIHVHVPCVEISEHSNTSWLVHEQVRALAPTESQY